MEFKVKTDLEERLVLLFPHLLNRLLVLPLQAQKSLLQLSFCVPGLKIIMNIMTIIIIITIVLINKQIISLLFAAINLWLNFNSILF